MKDNFNLALDLYNKKFLHDELIENLKNGSILEKQISALNLETINSKDEGFILMLNLVGVDGKIREAAAFKIHELICKKKLTEKFHDTRNYEILAQALIDIDSNVCRLVLEIISQLKTEVKFSDFFALKLKQIIYEVFEEMKKFTFRDKKYKTNKQVFKLYWCLEALNHFYKLVDFEDLKLILKKSSEFKEYTIREKCMKLLPNLLEDEELKLIYKKLKTDENYYVRNS